MIIVKFKWWYKWIYLPVKRYMDGIKKAALINGIVIKSSSE